MNIFNNNSLSRNSIITGTSWLGIITNVLLSTVKIVIGVLTSSIAIVSEGVNNATDSLTAIIALIGTKLANKHPDKNHPFGYKRIEYLTGFIIAIIIIFTGCQMLCISIKLAFNPAILSISYTSLMIVTVSAVIKFALGTYTVKVGKKVNSIALEAVGIDGRNDSFISIITIVSALFFLIFDISIDAYAGIIISVLIIKSGFNVLMDTISELLGKPGQKELVDKIYKEIYNTKEIINATDMILHNYGPDTWSGSVNIELDHAKTVEEVYKVIHKLQMKIKNEYKVVMVFGIYAVAHDHKDVKNIKKDINMFVSNNKHIKSIHAIYLEPRTNKIYCDFVVEHDLKEPKKLKDDFIQYMAKKYPNNEIELTIETEFV
jgi:cation diffusion facilitator family transporter